MTSNYFPKDQADLGNLEVGNLTHLFSLIVWTSVGVKFVLKSIYFGYNISPKDVRQRIPSSGRLSLESSLAGSCSASYFYRAWYALAACLYTDWAVKCMLLSPESGGNLRTTKDDKSGFLNIFPNSKARRPRWRAKLCKCPSERATFASSSWIHGLSDSLESRGDTDTILHRGQSKCYHSKFSQHVKSNFQRREQVEEWHQVKSQK